MAAKHLMKSGALIALAAGLAVAALPAAANAQEDRGRHGGWQQGGGEGRGGENRGGNWRGQQAQPAPQVQAQAQPQVQVQQAPRMDRGDTPGRGWGSDRDRGQRYGRDWSNGGAVNRPDAAWRNRAAEQAQQAQQAQQARQAQQQVQRQEAYRPQGAWRGSTAQQQVQRSYDGRSYDGQRTYSDAWRNRSYQPRANQQGWNGDRRWDGNRTGGWNRDWRRDNRFAWQSYRNQHRDVFRMGRYYSPYNNWSYRRLGIGFMLQPLFFSQDYWIDDPWMYRLPEAYGPYRWVRYYDDALLVNIYDGEVVDVIYDFFW